MHPFIPFVTEEIYQFLPTTKGTIVLAKWPEAEKKYQNPYFWAETCPEYRRNVLGWKD